MAFQKKHKENKTFFSGAFRAIAEIFAIFIFLVFGISFAENFYNRYQEIESGSITPGISYARPTSLRTVVLGDETEDSVFEEPVFKSENYQIKQVTFGGDITIPLDDAQNRSLEIEDVISELLTTSDQEDVKLVVSWKTNKPAISTIDYGKDLNSAKETIEESSYGFTHSTILSGLDYSSAYSYTIKTKDRWDNEFDSKEFAFYTGAPKVSLIDLLFGAFADVFGWAVKK
ncbi:hypothetical protein HN784_04925 [bacterium]|jgi:hypothetical protein|nr:hypothetical protein [bacterium]MBT4250760.1 hypothetical protein [bacterium]MBT4598157.1 hypothetical protein [bacterium]MBT6753755.1 hypothetical protein [bacterium]MBT7037532.1 hypothetical protein [bacterium]